LLKCNPAPEIEVKREEEQRAPPKPAYNKAAGKFAPLVRERNKIMASSASGCGLRQNEMLEREQATSRSSTPQPVKTRLYDSI